MPFPSSMPADGPDAVSPSLRSRRFQQLAAVVLVAALGASAGLDLIDNPQPLDVQLATAMNAARDNLQDWQGQLSRGLQVSLRAVADGRELPPAEATRVAQAAAASQPAAQAR